MNNKNKTYLFIALIILVLIVLGVAFFGNLISKTDQDLIDKEIEKKQAELRDKRIEEVKNLEEAQEKNNASQCSLIINSSTRDFCYDSIAQNNQDDSLCELISSEATRIFCIIKIHSFKAVQELSPDPCKSLTNIEHTQRCLEMAASEPCHDDSGGCDFGVDSDSDGLTDREEIFLYFSDPLNPDTDGDGYSDGLEVERGFNPLGE